MAVNKPNSALGNNPLAQGIFSKTEVDALSNAKVVNIKESTNNNQDSRINNLEKSPNNQEPAIFSVESRFLNKGEREAVNLRLPIELNDWLNDLLKKGKRQHGAKIPKEVWVQAALELFQVMPVNWEEIDSEENLRSVLLNLFSRIKNLE